MNEDSVSKSGEVPYRRRYVRVAVEMTVKYARDGESENKIGFSSDLGAGGIRLATEEDLPLGAVLMLHFPLPHVEREMVVRGRIVLSFYNAEDKRFLHGIVFTQIDPRDQEEIGRYVSSEIHRLNHG
ncbi:MAG: PilZ domain-containing protein [Candidatus Eremiobacteraeota bacterium]|nr:PilZ domain-containing protein [Candidatus Eremiobacteraeota bacterium]